MRRVASAGIVVAVGFVLTACAAPLVAGLTIGDVSTIAGLASTATTGKGLTDHALSYATGKDCNLVESVLRKDRKLCETPGSPATQEDFKGVFKDEKPKDEATPVKIVQVQQVALAVIVVPKSPLKTPGRQYAMISGPADANGAPTTQLIVFPDPKPVMPVSSPAILMASAAVLPVPKPRAP
ncbi:MAG: hypothetical protein HY243_04195 [Proteobacteria bacterium]|nr:hypothetical protein [Pseudomonadota bacterium]